jgi:hypothetical protein
VHQQACCYLCENPATTRDHVPPKSLFPKPRPNDLITVPCCAGCNTQYSRDEEHFRNNICMVVDYQHAQQIWENTRRSYTRRPQIRAEILQRIKEIRVGAATRPVLHFSVERTNRVLVKIAKGLAFHHSGQRLPSETVQADVYQDSRIPTLVGPYLRKFREHGEWGNIFRYIGGMAADQQGAGMWLLEFYRSLVFLIMLWPAKME